MDTKPTNNILKEQLIPDHLFLYVKKGSISFFDGNHVYNYREGEYCLARKNHLIKFILNGDVSHFQPILFCFDEPFLREFQEKHKVQPQPATLKSELNVIKLHQTNFIESFIQSLTPYYKGPMKLDEAFEDIKYEELLIILLKAQPELSGIFFNFDPPEKINLEAFMNRNFRFNIHLTRFAFLTGRSLSAFKRDFKQIFDETPSRWLVKKRLQEAYVLIKNEGQKPSNVYLNLGFESLSHFSVAFKKEFGMMPTATDSQK